MAGRIEKERLVGTGKGQAKVMTEMGRIWLIQWERIRDGEIYEIPDIQINQAGVLIEQKMRIGERIWKKMEIGDLFLDNIN